MDRIWGDFQMTLKVSRFNVSKLQQWNKTSRHLPKTDARNVDLAQIKVAFDQFSFRIERSVPLVQIYHFFKDKSVFVQTCSFVQAILSQYYGLTEIGKAATNHPIQYFFQEVNLQSVTLLPSPLIDRQ